MRLHFGQAKRIIILSLQPDPYKNILAGVKKHEFRRKFLKEPVNAFIYVSLPVQKIQAYIEFGEPIFDRVQKIGEIAEKEGTSTISSIYSYMEGLEKGFAVPILSIREIEPLSLEELRSTYKFTAPQSYMNIETNPLLKEDLMNRLS